MQQNEMLLSVVHVTISILLFPSTLDEALNDLYYISNVLGHKNSDRSSSDNI